MNRPSLRSLLSFSFNFYCTTTQRIIKGSSILAVLKINMWPVLKEFLVSAVSLFLYYLGPIEEERKGQILMESLWLFLS